VTRSRILTQLSELGVEPDQRVRVAIERLPKIAGVSDAHLLFELLRLNSSITSQFGTTDVGKSFAKWHPHKNHPRVDVAVPTPRFDTFLLGALERRRRSNTLGTNDLFVEWLTRATEEYSDRPYGTDILLSLLGIGTTSRVQNSYEAASFVKLSEKSSDRAEDFPLIIAVADDKLVVRLGSRLGDYIQAAGDALFPRRAILTHFKDRFGGFTDDEICELEDLINSARATEADFQVFFDAHRHFLRRWDDREVFSQVYLRRQDDGPLIPDFILTDAELSRAAILELKTPGPRLVRRQDNRDRFAACIAEARAQLLTYRDWFRDSANRARLKPVLRMDVYEPQLAVIIGRSADFKYQIDRQRLASRERDIDIVTYSDILTFARRRRLLIERG
jgi:hypothetical protein